MQTWGNISTIDGDILTKRVLHSAPESIRKHILMSGMDSRKQAKLVTTRHCNNAILTPWEEFEILGAG